MGGGKFCPPGPCGRWGDPRVCRSLGRPSRGLWDAGAARSIGNDLRRGETKLGPNWTCCLDLQEAARSSNGKSLASQGGRGLGVRPGVLQTQRAKFPCLEPQRQFHERQRPALMARLELIRGHGF